LLQCDQQIYTLLALKHAILTKCVDQILKSNTHFILHTGTLSHHPQYPE